LARTETMETTTKVCGNCKVEKSCGDFYQFKRTKDGLQYSCKECCKKYKQENADKIREYRKENSEREKEINKKWRKENLDKTREYNKQYYQENTYKRREQYKEWRQANPEYRKQYQNRRRNLNPVYKMICNIRSRVSSYCKAIKLNKNTRTKDMLGIDLAGFQAYMESKFQEGMTWDNYGQWHVDHIKPISLATTEQEIIELNHYTNLQPLWAVDNIKKSNKYEESH